MNGRLQYVKGLTFYHNHRLREQSRFLSGYKTMYVFEPTVAVTGM